MTRWFEDFANDLGAAGFDVTDVRIACANWRTSEARKMPSPGELIAYCRRVFDPARYASPVLPPPRRVVDPAERADVGQQMRQLAASLAAAGRVDLAQLARQPGETEAAQAERLWPNRRIDRVRAKEGVF